MRSQVSSYNGAVDAYNAKPADERDPASLAGQAGCATRVRRMMKAAQEKLAEARRQRNEAAGPRARAVAGARDTAPEKPSYGEQFADGVDGAEI